MGRWAQRRHGGSSVQGVSLNFIAEAEITDDIAGVITLTYYDDFDPDFFSPEDFLSEPGGAIGSVIFRTAPKVLQVTMNNVVTGDTQVTYTGPNDAVMHPQTKLYS